MAIKAMWRPRWTFVNSPMASGFGTIAFGNRKDRVTGRVVEDIGSLFEVRGTPTSDTFFELAIGAMKKKTESRQWGNFSPGTRVRIQVNGAGADRRINCQIVDRNGISSGTLQGTLPPPPAADEEYRRPYLPSDMAASEGLHGKWTVISMHVNGQEVHPSSKTEYHFGASQLTVVQVDSKAPPGIALWTLRPDIADNAFDMLLVVDNGIQCSRMIYRKVEDELWLAYPMPQMARPLSWDSKTDITIVRLQRQLSQGVATDTASSQVRESLRYYRGNGVARNEQRARSQLAQAAAEGDALAAMWIARAYLLGVLGFPKSDQRANELIREHEKTLQRFVQAGDADAALIASDFRRAGVSFPEDKDAAKELLNLAAMRGNAHAMFILGDQLHAVNDRHSAYLWWLRAASQDASALDEVAAEQFRRAAQSGLRKDLAHVLTLCSAQRGHAGAMRHLADIYDKGWLGAKDQNAAIAWRFTATGYAVGGNQVTRRPVINGQGPPPRELEWIEAGKYMAGYYPRMRVVGARSNGVLQGDVCFEAESGATYMKELYDDAGTFLKRVEYYPSGQQLREWPIVDGTVHGQVTAWFADGTLAVEQQFEKGVPQGPIVRYFTNGSVSVRAVCEDGAWNGERLHYLPDGRFMGRTFWQDGKQVGTNHELNFVSQSEYEEIEKMTVLVDFRAAWLIEPTTVHGTRHTYLPQ